MKGREPSIEAREWRQQRTGADVSQLLFCTLQTSNRVPRPQKHPTCSTAAGTDTKAHAAPRGEVLSETGQSLSRSKQHGLLQSVSIYGAACVLGPWRTWDPLTAVQAQQNTAPVEGARPGEEADLSVCQPLLGRKGAD